MKLFFVLVSTFAFNLSAHAQLGLISLADLAGTWNSPCYSAGNGATEHSQLSFTPGGEVTETARVSFDSQCSATFYTAVAKYDFSINADRLSGTVTPFDSTLEFDTQAGVDGANQSMACGFSNWSLAVPQTIISTSCGTRDTSNLQMGKVDANTLRITECQPGTTTCSTVDFVRGD